VTQLRERIFQGQLMPGTPLPELSLARELNVSQTTIRDALHQLGYSGLVTRRAHLGTTVTRLSPKDVRERLALRLLLEVSAALLAAQRMTPADFEELERRLVVLGEAVESDRYYEAAQADLDFHRYIWHCSGNETMAHVLELVTVPLFAFISIMRSHGLQKLSAVVAEHRPLIEALRGKDPAQIRTAFEKGATSSYESFLGNGDESRVAEMFGILG
jgi:DNA-binding GntR family transcriptional regulator